MGVLVGRPRHERERPAQRRSFVHLRDAAKNLKAVDRGRTQPRIMIARDNVDLIKLTARRRKLTTDAIQHRDCKTSARIEDISDHDETFAVVYPSDLYDPPEALDLIREACCDAFGREPFGVPNLLIELQVGSQNPTHTSTLSITRGGTIRYERHRQNERNKHRA
jgi:hypothetical protein